MKLFFCAMLKSFRQFHSTEGGTSTNQIRFVSHFVPQKILFSTECPLKAAFGNYTGIFGAFLFLDYHSLDENGFI